MFWYFCFQASPATPGRIDIVDRYVEKTLDLIRVQIDRQQSIDARARDHVRHQLRRDGHARRARPAILAGVAEIRHHRRDPLRRRPPAGVGHHQELHQILRRRTGRLHDEHVASAHVFHQLDADLAVAEPSHIRPPSCTCKCRAISCASAGFAFPVNTAIVNESVSLFFDMG